MKTLWYLAGAAVLVIGGASLYDHLSTRPELAQTLSVTSHEAVSSMPKVAAVQITHDNSKHSSSETFNTHSNSAQTVKTPKSIAPIIPKDVAPTPQQTAQLQRPFVAAPAPRSAPRAAPIRRCMNMSSMEAPNEGDWYNYKIRKRDIRAVANAGFDTIRMPAKVSGHTADYPPYKIDPVFLARMDEVINWGLEYGLQVIVDVHHYTELNENPDRHEPRLEAIWNQLAHHYSTAPPAVIFELINEPNDLMTVKRTDALNRRLLARVRQDNPHRWVIVGSAQWGSLDGLMKSNPPKDPKIISTFHSYTPYNFTHQGASWASKPPPLGTTWGSRKDMNEITKEFQQAKKWAMEQGNPMLLGEFGAIIKIPTHERARWTRFVRETAEANQIGWCYWDMMGGFKAWDRDVEGWVQPIINALIPRR